MSNTRPGKRKREQKKSLKSEKKEAFSPLSCQWARKQSSRGSGVPLGRRGHTKTTVPRCLYWSAGKTWSSSYIILAYPFFPVKRGVAQPGSAPALGAGSRRFKSFRPDQIFQPVFPYSDRHGSHFSRSRSFASEEKTDFYPGGKTEESQNARSIRVLSFVAPARPCCFGGVFHEPSGKGTRKHPGSGKSDGNGPDPRTGPLRTTKPLSGR